MTYGKARQRVVSVHFVTGDAKTCRDDVIDDRLLEDRARLCVVIF